MTEQERKIHNAAIKDALRQIELLPGYTISRKMAMKAIRSCVLRKPKKAEVVLKAINE